MRLPVLLQHSMMYHSHVIFRLVSTNSIYALRKLGFWFVKEFIKCLQLLEHITKKITVNGNKRFSKYLEGPTMYFYSSFDFFPKTQILRYFLTQFTDNFLGGKFVGRFCLGWQIIFYSFTVDSCMKVLRWFCNKLKSFIKRQFTIL